MRKVVTMFALVISMLAVSRAQSPVEPLKIPSDLIEVAKGGALGESAIYLVPHINLYVTANGSVWVREGKAQAHGKYFVEGLDKATLQGLAKQIHNDLIGKLKGAGLTVLSYDDVKSEPDLVKRDRREPDDNPKYGGMATWKERDRSATYVVVGPSDEQTLKPVLQGPTWALRNVTKDKSAVLLVPELWFAAPQMIGEKEAGYRRDKAGFNVTPAMKLHSAFAWTLNHKGGGATIKLKYNIKVSDSVGQVEKASENKTDFGDWKRTSGDFGLTVDRAAFAAGILSGGYGFNDSIVAAIVKEKK